MQTAGRLHKFATLSGPDHTVEQRGNRNDMNHRTAPHVVAFQGVTVNKIEPPAQKLDVYLLHSYMHSAHTACGEQSVDRYPSTLTAPTAIFLTESKQNQDSPSVQY